MAETAKAGQNEDEYKLEHEYTRKHTRINVIPTSTSTPSLSSHHSA